MQYKPTIGADFLTKETEINGTLVSLQLWDTAGEEKFHSMGASFYRNSECCVLVFDLTDENTFETIDSWKTEFLNQLNPKDPENFPFVLVGNKCDLSDNIKVTKDKIDKYIEKNSNMKYFETSAKDNIKVNEVFQLVGKLAFNRNNNNEISFIPNKKIVLSKQTNDIKKRKCCSK
jgi:Ras-related protein Rab-7A